jgi:hypothetical protein
VKDQRQPLHFDLHTQRRLLLRRPGRGRHDLLPSDSSVHDKELPVLDALEAVEPDQRDVRDAPELGLEVLERTTGHDGDDSNALSQGGNYAGDAWQRHRSIAVLDDERKGAVEVSQYTGSRGLLEPG